VATTAELVAPIANGHAANLLEPPRHLRAPVLRTPADLVGKRSGVSPWVNKSIGSDRLPDPDVIWRARER
jgi:hypothetical protein